MGSSRDSMGLGGGARLGCACCDRRRAFTRSRQTLGARSSESAAMAFWERLRAANFPRALATRCAVSATAGGGRAAGERGRNKQRDAAAQKDIAQRRQAGGCARSGSSTHRRAPAQGRSSSGSSSRSVEAAARPLPGLQLQALAKGPGAVHRRRVVRSYQPAPLRRRPRGRARGCKTYRGRSLCRLSPKLSSSPSPPHRALAPPRLRTARPHRDSPSLDEARSLSRRASRLNPQPPRRSRQPRSHEDRGHIAPTSTLSSTGSASKPSHNPPATLARLHCARTRPELTALPSAGSHGLPPRLAGRRNSAAHECHDPPKPLLEQDEYEQQSRRRIARFR